MCACMYVRALPWCSAHIQLRCLRPKLSQAGERTDTQHSEREGAKGECECQPNACVSLEKCTSKGQRGCGGIIVHGWHHIRAQCAMNIAHTCRHQSSKPPWLLQRPAMRLSWSPSVKSAKWRCVQEVGLCSGGGVRSGGRDV